MGNLDSLRDWGYAKDYVELLGDPSKAKTKLGWNPRKTGFDELVKIMVEYDMKYSV